MTEQWYWKHRGQTIGPLDTEQLGELIRRHRVFDRDEIRLATEAEWISGAQIKALFVEGRAATAEVASKLLSEAARGQLNRGVEAAQDASLFEGWLRRLRSVPELPAGLIGAVLSRLLALLVAAFESKVLRSALCGVFVVGLLVAFYYRSQENRRVYDRLWAAAEEVREIQAVPVTEFSPERWRQLQAETRAWLEPTIKSLESAAARHPAGQGSWFETRATGSARRHLIQAARDLQCMLTEIPAPSGCSLHFLAAMEKARRDLSGRAASTGSGAAGPDSEKSYDRLTAAVIAVDVILVIGGLVYWLRRRLA